MATQEKSGFEKAESPDESNDFEEDDAVWIERPAEGDSVQGILLERTPEAGQFNTPLYKLRRTDDHDDDEGPIALMWSSQSIDKVVTHNSLTTGDEVLIEGTDMYTFEGDDGEEQEAVNYEVYFK